MHWIGETWRRMLFLFRRGQFHHDLEEEMADHVRLKAGDLSKQGIPPEEAKGEARLEFGNALLLREKSHDAWGLLWLETLLQDLRYGLRQLRRNPGFTAVAVITLALGIGANTAIFSVVEAALLRMLPVKNPGQLVHLTWVSPHNAGDTFSFPAFEQFSGDNQIFSGVVAFGTPSTIDVGVNGEGLLARGQIVSGSYFSVLGVTPLLGRVIVSEDNRVPGASPVAVISYTYWVRRFGRDASVVGRRITLNDFPFTVVGVAAQGFYGLEPGESVDMWVPDKMMLQVEPSWAALGGTALFKDPSFTDLQIIGRLRPRLTNKQAVGYVQPQFQRIEREAAVRSIDDPVRREMISTRIALEPGSRGLSELRQRFSEPLLNLMIAVGLVLLIACANVAGLLVARAASRCHEIAIRLALGGGRRRLIRQLITESVLLALGGGALGLLFAYMGTQLLLHLLSKASHPITLIVHPDSRIIGFTVLVAVLSGILFGVAPTFQATRLDLVSVLKTGVQTTTGGRRSWLVKALVVSEVSLSFVSLILAGLFARTLTGLRNLQPGFNEKHVLLLSVDTVQAGYKGERLDNLYRAILQRLRALPGVVDASFSMVRPISGDNLIFPVTLRGHNAGPTPSAAYFNLVGPNFFRTLGTPVLFGRGIIREDASGMPPVAVINQTMARSYFGGLNPIGRHFGLRWPPHEGSLEIVGVAADAKYSSLRQITPAAAYIPAFQFNPTVLGNVTFELRTAGSPATLATAARRAIMATDRGIPIFGVRTLVQQIDESLVQEHLMATLAGLFGLLALLLAGIGLYGLMAYSVAQRTHEVGVRMALGAHKGAVLRLVLRQGMTLALVGEGVGIAGAICLTRVVSTLLYGVKPNDPLTFIAVSWILTGVALLACYIPARRATKVDPMVALRHE
jgi:predicted permease